MILSTPAFDIRPARLNVGGTSGECSFSGAEHGRTCLPTMRFADLSRPRAIDPCEWWDTNPDEPPNFRAVAVRAAAVVPCKRVLRCVPFDRFGDGPFCSIIVKHLHPAVQAAWTGRCVP